MVFFQFRCSGSYLKEVVEYSCSIIFMMMLTDLLHVSISRYMGLGIVCQSSVEDDGKLLSLIMK